MLFPTLATLLSVPHRSRPSHLALSSFICLLKASTIPFVAKMHWTPATEIQFSGCNMTTVGRGYVLLGRKHKCSDRKITNSGQFCEHLSILFSSSNGLIDQGAHRHGCSSSTVAWQYTHPPQPRNMFQFKRRKVHSVALDIKMCVTFCSKTDCQTCTDQTKHANPRPTLRAKRLLDALQKSLSQFGGC